MKPESQHNFIASRIEFWKDRSLCDEAARIQAEHEWAELEHELLQGRIVDLAYEPLEFDR